MTQVGRVERWHMAEAPNGAALLTALCGARSHDPQGWERSAPRLDGSLCGTCRRMAAERGIPLVVELGE